MVIGKSEVEMQNHKQENEGDKASRLPDASCHEAWTTMILPGHHR
jgi:hypothetical protein